MSDSFEKDEYFALVKSVADFDQRLLTVKGWGVTLSLAALGLGFQYRAHGFFLIAAASSLAFWVIEHAGKRHQMRHYVRIREIEVNQYRRAGLLPYVALPHAITLAIGLDLFGMGVTGALANFTLGTPPAAAK